MDRLKSLQESINLEKAAEWEVGFESGLSRKEISSENEGKGYEEESGQNNVYGNNQNRFRPYNSNARVRSFETGVGRGSRLRGKGKGNISDRHSERMNLSSHTEITCHKSL